VDCETHRLALSAGLDGEATELEHHAALAHVRRCTECAMWLEEATDVTRAVRLSSAEEVPDLTAAILVASPAIRPVAADVLPIARIGLALVAFAQLLIGQESLLDAGGIAAHLSRETGVWEVALAIGFATAAWRPRRAAGLVPLVAALAFGLIITSTIDAADGAVAVLSEGHHLIALLGFGLLVVSTRVSSPGRRLVVG